ncbi:hypothetical protein EZV73_24500 [Acidaminobacter sp. JC074]|uniref:hypothetical protein n=1 Tax=Acidaminobacter sp. JC074 TaxID=2530199 RepID=UPI001F10EEF4|nr:hypothetical protein [Acidaminobacter sp. JC074]MCH4890762.1 hypothetical protein [Acidaminobacter sp. JC074]
MSIILVIIMSFMIYIVLENNRIQILFEYLRLMDSELEKKIIPFIDENHQVDIFTVQEIRNMLKKEFINKHLIDEFKVYKEDMYKVHVMVRRGLAVQGLELVTTNSRLHLVETSMAYSNIEFSKK